MFGEACLQTGLTRVEKNLLESLAHSESHISVRLTNNFLLLSVIDTATITISFQLLHTAHSTGEMNSNEVFGVYDDLGELTVIGLVGTRPNDTVCFS